MWRVAAGRVKLEAEALRGTGGERLILKGKSGHFLFLTSFVLVLLCLQRICFMCRAANSSLVLFEIFCSF